MNQTLVVVLLGILSYLIGSLPSSVWTGMAFFGVDVRDHGSGNAGATNTFRVLGTKTGFFVLFLDIIKGVTAVSLVHFIDGLEPESVRFVNLQLMFGLLAVIGHIFPVYVNFKGGKGIATLFGMLIGIHWVLALICVSIFLVVLFTTRYVSLGSILATIAFPIIIIFVFPSDKILLITFALAAALLVLLTHRKNIVRLLQGKENKAKLFSK